MLSIVTNLFCLQEPEAETAERGDDNGMVVLHCTHTRQYDFR